MLLTVSTPDRYRNKSLSVKTDTPRRDRDLGRDSQQSQAHGFETMHFTKCTLMSVFIPKAIQLRLLHVDAASKL